MTLVPRASLLLAVVAAACSGATTEPGSAAAEPLGTAAHESGSDPDEAPAAAEPAGDQSQARQLVHDLLAASVSKSRRLVLDEDWDRAAGLHDSLLVSWPQAVRIPSAAAGGEVLVLDALVVASGPFRRSVLVRGPDGLSSPFLVGDEDLWRRALQLTAR